MGVPTSEQRPGEQPREEEHANGGGHVHRTLARAIAAQVAARLERAAREAAALKVRPHREGAQDGEVAQEGDPHPADEEGERAVEVEG